MRVRTAASLVHDARGLSFLGVVVALLLIAGLVWMAMGRLQPTAVSDDLPAPMDRGRQQRTLADMRSIDRALQSMRVSQGSYPRSLAELWSAGYLAKPPVNDAWGNNWEYEPDQRGYRLRSLGSDGERGPTPPLDWRSGCHECDLEMINGQVTQGPRR